MYILKRLTFVILFFVAFFLINSNLASLSISAGEAALAGTSPGIVGPWGKEKPQGIVGPWGKDRPQGIVGPWGKGKK